MTDEELTERKLLERRLSRVGKNICTECDLPFDSTELVSMRVVFHEHGTNKTLKSRTIGKLCPSCLDRNEYWNAEARYV